MKRFGIYWRGVRRANSYCAHEASCSSSTCCEWTSSPSCTLF